MPDYKCKECGHVQPPKKGMPPTTCDKCGAKGSIWEKITSAAAKSSSSTDKPSGKLKMPGQKAKSGASTSGMPGSKGGMPDPKGGMPIPTSQSTQNQSAGKSGLHSSTGNSNKSNKSAGPTNSAGATKSAGLEQKSFVQPEPRPPVSETKSSSVKSTSTTPVESMSPPVESVPPIQSPASLDSQPEPEPTPVSPVRNEDSQNRSTTPVTTKLSDRVVWMYPEVVEQTAAPQRNCPAQDDLGRVYFAIGNKLVAFNSVAGAFTHVWDYRAGDRIQPSPVVGPDGNLRIHSSDGFLHVVSRDGQAIGGGIQVGESLGWSTPLVDSQNNTWISAYHGGLVKVESGKAESKIFFRRRERFDCTGLIHDDVLYVGAENGCVFAVGIGQSRGANRWDHLNNQGRTGWYINSAIACASGPTLVVASRDDKLHGFSLDGESKWTVELGGQALGSPVVDDGDAVYLGLSIAEGLDDPSGALIRVDGVSRKITWRFETSSPIESTPVVGQDGTVYFGDNDGIVRAVDSDGKLVWDEQLASAIRSPGTIIDGKVIFGMENGQFVALKCDSSNPRPKVWSKFLGTAKHSGSPA